MKKSRSYVLGVRVFISAPRKDTAKNLSISRRRPYSFLKYSEILQGLEHLAEADL